MARTKKGSKGPGFEYWTKRPGNKHGGLIGAFQKHYTHKVERQQNKPTKAELSDAMTDLAEMRDKCGDPHCEYCGTPVRRPLDCRVMPATTEKNMGDKYILDGKRAVECHDLMAWAKWFETGDRRVADETIGDVRVSTVFLSLDHSFGAGPPMLFETMVFGGPMDQEQDRCTTWDEAEAMHAAMVARVKEQGSNE